MNELSSYYFAVPPIIAAAICSTLIILLSPIARKIELVDVPDERKKHGYPVPLIGGISMFIALTLCLLLYPVSFEAFRLLMFSATVIVIVGVLDDHRDIPAWSKILVQVLIALLLTVTDSNVVLFVGDLLNNGRIQGLGPLAIPFSIVAIVGVINAFNMIDGHDGVCGLITFISIVALIFIYIVRGEGIFNQYLVILTLLATVVFVFLTFNLGIWVSKSYQIFMGDAGSMFIGLIVVFVLIRFTTMEPAILKTTSAAWIIGIPLLDMATVILFRVMRGVSPLSADRTHIHHVLLMFGANKLFVPLLIGGVHSIFVAIGICGSLFEWPDHLLFWGMFAVLALHLLLLMILSRTRMQLL